MVEETKGLDVDEDTLVLFWDDVELDERSDEDVGYWLLVSYKETTLRSKVVIEFVDMMSDVSD
ncbi:hypothetical protein KI387_023816 [Taxus chinensis]|uniref:Uncharacterized protein n=1 Tax=Taxus chinensis TaxID=29808 RepID=A0AA38G2B8_TAXCH|nr:hypothetical protein KI387_023816 [Taxus chinensis]